jgi:hypothetical protein
MHEFMKNVARIGIEPTTLGYSSALVVHPAFAFLALLSRTELPDHGENIYDVKYGCNVNKFKEQENA